MQLTALLKIAHQQKASDLHLSPGLPPQLRTHGELVSMKEMPPLTGTTIQELLHGLLSKEQRLSLETALELDFSIVLDGLACRGNVFYQLHGLAAVFRLISPKLPTLEELALPPVFQMLLHSQHGLILVTGSTGCGKSTTLAAMINAINLNQARHIITLEDPIEFIHHSKKSIITQRQIQRDTQDFNSALRSALRQNPDIILIGEIRDLDTMRLALTAAETGHLVMATLHTSSCSRTINRIIDIFPASEKNMIRNMVAESLLAVICQTLLPHITEGRVAAFEIMLGTQPIRHLIREDKIAQMMSVMQTNGDLGMCTLDQYLQKLLSKQVIHASVARQAATIKDNFFIN